MADQTQRLEIATVRAEVGSSILYRVANDPVAADPIPTGSGDIPNLKQVIAEIQEEGAQKISVATTIYPSVEAGLAATTDGGIFLVQSDEATEIYKVWKNDGGSAVNTGKTAMSSEAIEQALQSSNEAAQAAEDAADVATNRTAGFLAPSATPPEIRDNGLPLQLGDRYFNTEDQAEYIYTDAGWVSNDSAQALQDFKVELADPATGAEQVGWDSGLLSDSLKNLGSFSNYTALKAYSGPVTACWIRDINQFGQFEVDPADTMTAGDDITVVVDALNRRWKRKYSGSVNIRWAGAKGDGSDDTPAIQKCLDLYKRVLIPKGGFWATELAYKLGVLEGEDQSLSVLHKIGNGPLIKVHGSLGEAVTLSEAPAIGYNTAILTSNVQKFSPGEWAVLESEDSVYIGEGGGRAGEIVRIQKQVGAVVTLHAPIIFSYTTTNGVRLRKVNWLEGPTLKGFQIRMNYAEDLAATNQADAINYMFCLRPTTDSLRIREGNRAGVRLTCCVEGLVDAPRVEDLASADDDVNGGFGYGVLEQAANIGLIVRGGHFSRVRSAYTTGFGWNDVYPHGVSVNALIDGNVATDTFSSSFTTHPSGIYTQISNNQIHGCRAMGIQVRAKGTVVRGNTISRTMGAGIIINYDNGAVADAVIDNNTLFDTNQGNVPDGTNHREIGAIHDSSPNAVITDNKIFRCGGPAIRTLAPRLTTITGNRAYNPCQRTITRKYAYGGENAGTAGDYVLFSDNLCMSTDGKVTNFLVKHPTTTFEGSNNIARGISGAFYNGEASNCYLTGSNSGVDKNGRGQAVVVRLASDTLDLTQTSVLSSMVVVQAEAGSASDTLATIVGGMEGCEIMLRCVTGHTITVAHGTSSATNNIRTSSGSSVVLTGTYQWVRFVRYQGLWVQC